VIGHSKTRFRSPISLEKVDLFIFLERPLKEALAFKGRNSKPYILLCPIINTRHKCLTKYDNYMVIGDLNLVLLCPNENEYENESNDDEQSKQTMAASYVNVVQTY
jgi:hypothetical protein